MKRCSKNGREADHVTEEEKRGKQMVMAKKSQVRHLRTCYAPLHDLWMCGKPFGAPIVGAAGPAVMESLPTADQPDWLVACKKRCNLWTAATEN